MLDMVDYKALDYERTKEMVRDAEIKILERSCDVCINLAAVLKAAKRIVLLKKRHMLYFNASNHYMASERAGFLAGKKKLADVACEPGSFSPGQYYRALFAATVGKRMLDEWDAEDEQTMQKEGAHE